MFKKIFNLKNRDKKKSNHDAALALQLSEAKEISDIIFKRLEKMMVELKAMESSVSEKMAILERLIRRAESIKPVSEEMNRHREIVALSKKGLKIDEIADFFDMPAGEVELILNLYHKKS